MPHLTSTGTARRTSGAEQFGFGVPGYAHPLLAPAEWAELARPGTPLHWAVLNIDNGPGTRPDPHCLEAAGRLRNARERALHGAEPLDSVRAAGGRLLGQLDLAHGARPFDELIADARAFLDWYRVDGFYLDRCPADRADLPSVRRLTGTLSAFLEDSDSGQDGGHLVLGHDTHPYPGYAEAADQLVTFRGAWTDYRWSQVAEWTAAYPPCRFAHFVHGVPRSHLEEAMRIARWQGAGTIFFTDRTGHPDPANGRGQTDPFATPPRYWDEIVSRIGPGISE
ncbi:spherulation-specific family 4 protein [Streptomyces sp. ITFR-16]|uniref:spherulation-specific family 4 protein n=1 Tax=Streptomyces sp. ITFR-16 TaxID=3075198 RepID=UPI0028892666|nr:spherulation-specific family 4 protein [Streptomyces sp. ITFR-16]WNI22585.1 spherulation-specific family 4 protein [Streptomyces sp. ITFR-16]